MLELKSAICFRQNNREMERTAGHISHWQFALNIHCQPLPPIPIGRPTSRLSARLTLTTAQLEILFNLL